MWLYGLVVAEGSKKSISLHKEEKEMANYAKYIYKMIVNLNSNTFYKENGQAVEFEQPFIYQKIFFDAMRIGYGAHNKTLSFLFSIEDKELIRSALFGLFQGDGAFRKRNMGLKSKSFNLTFKTVSKKLVYELAYLLRKHFGICAAVYHGVSPDRYLEGRLLKSSDYYKLDIYASEDIENLFPAIFEKDEDYKKLISNKSKKNSLKEIKIKSIEETDPEVLYDITLEESSSHIFPVNGYVLTHNCGGGNALEHPEFISFLREAKNRGWICNVTVNQKHLDSLVLPEVIKAGLVYGVGISVVSKGFADNIKRIRDLSPNVVFHVINGINKPEDVDWLCEGYDLTKVLLLGYKEFGRGLEYLARKNKVSEIKQQWLWKIRSYLGRKDLIMSFDNLAIEQTQVKRFLKQATWDKHFMGEEGQFSMYVDAIKQQYALTSTSEARTSFQDKSLLEFFKYKR
jgi:hypothetical protein